MIYIINNCFQENFKDVSSQLIWTDMSLLPETEDKLFHSHRNDDDYPNCEKTFCKFDSNFILNF